MKHNILLIILVVLTIFSYSCEQESTKEPLGSLKPLPERITAGALEKGEIETGTVPGDYIYKITANHQLVKYHIPTGTANWVCQDPFCTHDRTTCPCNVGDKNLAAIGNILYYSVQIDDKWCLRSYDGDEMKFEEIRISKGVLNHLFSYNHYLYFSETLPTSNEGGTQTTVYRVDTQSGALDIIDCGYPYAIIDSIELGKIIWNNSGKMISTNLDGDDATVYNQTFQREWGNYVFSWHHDGTCFTKLYRTDLSTNEKILIGQDMAFFFFYGDKVLYLKYLDTPRDVSSETGTKIKDPYGGDVYIMNFDGTNNHLLCHVDDFCFAGTSSNRNNEFTCGDWVGISSKSYYADESGQGHFSTADMLIVNVITEEYKLIKFNPYE